MMASLGRESVRLHMHSGGTDRSTNLTRKRYENAGEVFFFEVRKWLHISFMSMKNKDGLLYTQMRQILKY